jgi:hypothetical protein
MAWPGWLASLEGGIVAEGVGKFGLQSGLIAFHEEEAVPASAANGGAQRREGESGVAGHDGALQGQLPDQLQGQGHLAAIGRHGERTHRHPQVRGEGLQDMKARAGLMLAAAQALAPGLRRGRLWRCGHALPPEPARAGPVPDRRRQSLGKYSDSSHGTGLDPQHRQAVGVSLRPQRAIAKRSLAPGSIAASDSVKIEVNSKRRPFFVRGPGILSNAAQSDVIHNLLKQETLRIHQNPSRNAMN